MTESKCRESENQNADPEKNAGYWIKLRHDRRMQGEGVSCSVLLASDYERGAYSDADWGDLEIGDSVLMRARDTAQDLIEAAVPSAKSGIMRDEDGKLRRFGAHISAVSYGSSNENKCEWDICCNGMRLVAGTRSWIERALEQAEGDNRVVGDELARIAVEESGILTYLEKHYPELN